jgi:hypothetical protein
MYIVSGTISNETEEQLLQTLDEIGIAYGTDVLRGSVSSGVKFLFFFQIQKSTKTDAIAVITNLKSTYSTRLRDYRLDYKIDEKVGDSSSTPATSGTMTVPMDTDIKTITPTGACTFNAIGGYINQEVTFIITTNGTTSFTLTFGTNFRKVGTLATGTTSARFFAVTFKCINGTTWQEIARTAVQT